MGECRIKKSQYEGHGVNLITPVVDCFFFLTERLYLILYLIVLLIYI